MPRAQLRHKASIRKSKTPKTKLNGDVRITSILDQSKSLLRKFEKFPIYIKLGTATLLLLILTFSGLQLRHHQLYMVSAASRQLLSKSSVETNLVKVISKAVSYDASSVKPTLKKDVTIAAPTDATGKTGYQATINTDFHKGLTFGDSNSQLSFQMTPLFDASGGQYDNGQIMFPVSTSTKIFQTFKKNGIKEDIVLSGAPGRTASWQWHLSLGDKLTAKLLPDGSVGIYAASPYLYGNIQINDAKSQALIDKARTTDKNYQVFAIPAPVIKDALGHILQEDVSFKLSGDTLTLEARNLINKHYPISIDPSVVITTTADFATSYSGDGMINYATAGQISRSTVGLGTVGATTGQAAAFTTARDAHTSVAYNGYLYVIGGVQNIASATGCDVNGLCNDIQYCPINVDGSIGTCVQQLAAFTTPRYYHTSVAYNGYLYIIGGFKKTGSATGCIANGLCDDIQHCPINTNGSVGTCVQQLAAFTSARSEHTSIAYNGYLYVIGGGATANATGCDSVGNCNDIQHCPINADGSVGTCVQQLAAFTTPRVYSTSVVYNGYLYVIGGGGGASATGCNASGYCNDIQYCPINADGSIGTCVQQLAAFTTPRYIHSSVAYNGYLYVIGGYSGAYQNDIQYCPINSDGSVGGCVQQTSAFTTARTALTSVAYNGYLYVIGGWNGTVTLNDIQHLLITSGTPTGLGAVGATTVQSAAFTTGRSYFASVAYNGYLYVIGGTNGTVYYNDIQHCPINTDGSVGTCVQQTNAFTTARDQHTSVVYNGYLYVIGGIGTANAAGCDASGYCGDIQHCPINIDGSVGTCVQQLTAFTTARYGHTSVAYNGYLYVIGGYSGAYQSDTQHCPINTDGSVGTCVQQASAISAGLTFGSSVAFNGYLYVIGGNYNSDVQHLAIYSQSQSAHYERMIDIGTVANSVDYIRYNGTAKCGVQIQYATAGSSGIFSGYTTVMPDAISGTTYNISGQSNIRYVRVIITLNDQSCGVTSTVTDITVGYSLTPPAAPTLSAPASGATSVSLTPLFQLKTTHATSTYAQYKILVYQSDCSTLVRTIDQTASQTGWSGQDAQTATAYVLGATLGASTIASHTYQVSALNASTAYCWKGAAINPAGSNVFGAYSATQLFTTSASNQSPTAPTLTQPVSSQIGVSTTPEFRLYAIDADSDYVRYKILLYQSDCTTIVRTIDQTSLQTGWTSQSQQSATAYSSGQSAIHTYQPTALSLNTTYCWKAAAIDPAGTNLFGSYSTTSTFTTQTTATPTQINITGGTIINGNTTIHP